MAKKAAKGKKLGRPPAADPKVPVNARVPLSLREKCESAAAASGVPWAKWVADALAAFCKRKPRPPKPSP